MATDRVAYVKDGQKTYHLNSACGELGRPPFRGMKESEAQAEGRTICTVCGTYTRA